MLGPQQISGSNIRLGTLEIRYCRTNCLIENENISVMEAFMKRFEVATWFTLKGVLKAKYIHHKFPEKKHWLYCGSEVIQGYSLCEFFCFIIKPVNSELCGSWNFNSEFGEGVAWKTSQFHQPKDEQQNCAWDSPDLLQVLPPLYLPFLFLFFNLAPLRKSLVGSDLF